MEDKRQPDPGQRRSVTASRVLPMFPHRRLDLGRSLIKKTRASTAVSEAFAEAAKPANPSCTYQVAFVIADNDPPIQNRGSPASEHARQLSPQRSGEFQ